MKNRQTIRTLCVCLLMAVSCAYAEAQSPMRNNRNDCRQTENIRYKGAHKDRMPYCPQYLDKKSFGILRDKVHKASFDSNRIDLIEVACLGCCFTCSQCARLMREFSFDDTKLKALKVIAPRIIDPQNAVEIYKTLSFSSSKDEAGRILQKGMKRR